jgi:hypothetical protein
MSSIYQSLRGHRSHSTARDCDDSGVIDVLSTDGTINTHITPGARRAAGGFRVLRKHPPKNAVFISNFHDHSMTRRDAID